MFITKQKCPLETQELNCQNIKQNRKIRQWQDSEWKTSKPNGKQTPENKE